MSQFCIYIDVEPYLAQWFINSHGGSTPVELERASVESKILEVFLTKQPPEHEPEIFEKQKVAIYIPTFRNRPAAVYNYLPRRAQAALLLSIRNRFDVQLWNDLHHFGAIGQRQDELIYAWMEKTGIDLTEVNWNAIAKRYQRQRNIYLNNHRINTKKND